MKGQATSGTMHRLLCILGASLLLTGCLSPGEARLPGGTYQLQSPTEGPLIDVWQEVVATDKQGTRKLLAHVLNRPGATRLTLLEPTSLVTMLQCDFDGKRATRSGPLLAERIPAELPLAILQLSLWPEGSARKGLTGDLQITEKGGHRIIWDGDEVFAEIAGQPSGPMVIRLPGYATVIHIREAEQR